MKKIRLGGKSSHRFTLVDDDDFEKFAEMAWCANRQDYVCSKRTVNKKQITVFLHRLILSAPKGTQVDHINRNPLDNRKENLRLATPSQNARNAKMRADNTSGFRGVVWDKRAKKWKAQITQCMTVLHLGYHPTKEEAACAYDAVAHQLQGEFAALNFPESLYESIEIDNISRPSRPGI